MNPMLANRLIRLQLLNRSAPREYKIEAAADSEEATIYLYDVIGYDWWSDGGITSKQFAKDLRALGSKTLHLRVNSPGGDVFEGRAMVAALQDYPGQVIAHVDGLAASAASFLVMHADEVEMTDGSFMMIHNGWTFAMGDRHAMRETGDLLEKIDGSIVDDYQKKSGAEPKQIGDWMDAETWFTAAEAVEAGLADRIAPDKKEGKAKACARASAWNLSAYDHPPKDLAPEAAPTPAPPAEEPEIVPEPDLAALHAHRLRTLALVETHPA